VTVPGGEEPKENEPNSNYFRSFKPGLVYSMFVLPTEDGSFARGHEALPFKTNHINIAITISEQMKIIQDSFLVQMILTYQFATRTGSSEMAAAK
jgi:hypothetical protein